MCRGLQAPHEGAYGEGAGERWSSVAPPAFAGTAGQRLQSPAGFGSLSLASRAGYGGLADASLSFNFLPDLRDRDGRSKKVSLTAAVRRRTP